MNLPHPDTPAAPQATGTSYADAPIELPSIPSKNPCLNCGACCAFFRCSFYWGEADDETPGGVPVGLTENITIYRRAMRGTNQSEPRCTALTGEIGVSAGCGIYERRPSTCRKFVPSWYNGERNEDCDRARIKHGLPPLTPDAWKQGDETGDSPRQPEDPTKPKAA